VEDGKYKLIKESIQTDGITDPMKVQSGTNVIIGGHTRCRIALELQLMSVPDRYYDVVDETAKYIMVMDNHTCIGDEKALMKLAWTFRVVVDSVGIPHGGDRRSKTDEEESGETNGKRKTQQHIADSFGINKRHFQRHLACYA